MPNISKERLAALQLTKPRYDLQVRFAEAAARLDSVRERALHTRDRVAQLFSNLVRRAFSGALTASWREAHMKELLQEMEQQAKALAQGER